MHKCSSCKRSEPDVLFNERKDRAGRKQAYCVQCQKDRHKQHYQENKSKYMERLSRRRLEISQAIDERKSKPCMDCKNSFPPIAMDFDHRPGEVKISDISKISRKHGWSLQRVIEEIEKCDLVCSNCHRIRTQTRSMSR